jgi:hypothetical protein
MIDVYDSTAGYHLIFWPSPSFSGHWGIRIDIARFVIQLIVILTAAGAAYLILGQPRK